MLQSHTPPIAPSPARLGLAGPTTASSPSLLPNPNPNPNPNPSTKPPPPSAQHHNGPAPTPSALLSLLPPLPRAQSLLHQMAALSTKLFEVSPHRAQWVSAFRGALPSFLPSSAPTEPRTPSSTKEVLSLFTSLQTQLFEAVAELQEILDLQDSRGKVARDVRSRDATLLSFAHKLKDAEQVLDQLVDDYSDYRRKPKRSKGNQDAELGSNSEYSLSLHSSLDLQEVLAYAHRISYTTFAPPEHGAGAPLRGALPPAPQDNEMRASQLYQFADLDVGVLKKAPDTKDRASDPLAEPLMQPTPPREELLPPAISPHMLPINVLPGWKKGMPDLPFALPFELPPCPPGWKPGDPIVIPTVDKVLPGSRDEEPRPSGVPVMMLPGMPVPQPKAPEAIQVQPVILDIDHDAYSSEYSSDVGSSDEDDED